MDDYNIDDFNEEIEENQESNTLKEEFVKVNDAYDASQATEGSDTPEEEFSIVDDAYDVSQVAEGSDTPENEFDTVDDSYDASQATEGSDTPEDEFDIDSDSEDESSEELQDLSGTTYEENGHKYYLDSNGEIYRVDDVLMDNMSYDLNGYHYATDNEGRITDVEGKLHLRDRDRLTIKDKIYDIALGDELETDDRGHIIADLLDGPNGLENLVAQDFSINRGEYKQFESELADLVKNDNDVYAQYRIVYPDGSFRPESIVVDYSVNGEDFERTFTNCNNK